MSLLFPLPLFCLFWGLTSLFIKTDPASLDQMRNSTLNYKSDCTQDLFPAITSAPKPPVTHPAEEAWHKQVKRKSYTSTVAVNSLRLIKRWHLEVYATIISLCTVVDQLYSVFCLCMRSASFIRSVRWTDIVTMNPRRSLFTSSQKQFGHVLFLGRREEKKHKKTQELLFRLHPTFLCWAVGLEVLRVINRLLHFRLTRPSSG